MKKAFDLMRSKIMHDRRIGRSSLEAFLEILKEVEAEHDNGGGKKKYSICLNGCDDDTVFEMELTENEYQLLSKVSEMANKTSTYGCMPRMYVEPYKQEEGAKDGR